MALVSDLLKFGYKATAVYHDLYVAKKNGSTNQIDVVLCTEIGLIVIEVKDYSGWIFGNGHQKKWTQITQYGRNKNYFYNPIRQNASHIFALKQNNALRSVPMYSLVVFYGICELKSVSQIPNGVYVQYGRCVFETLTEIIRQNVRYDYQDKWKVVSELKKYVLAGDNRYIRDGHIARVRQYEEAC